LRRLRLVLEYDGTPFRGFQRQPEQPTVQGALEQKLSAVCGHPVQTVGAGRTDTGVHALGQVAHFDTTGRIPADRLARAVNSLPPYELVVREVEETGTEFHARYDAVRRTYYYYVSPKLPPPFLTRYVAHEVRLRADGPERMRSALPSLLGRHDFAAFHVAGAETGPTERTLFHAALSARGDLLRLELTADGFLRSMVRMIAGTLLEIGRGWREPEALARILASREQTPAATAPPHGLFLMRVEYPDGFPVRPGSPGGDNSPAGDGAWTGPDGQNSIWADTLGE